MDKSAASTDAEMQTVCYIFKQIEVQFHLLALLQVNHAQEKIKIKHRFVMRLHGLQFLSSAFLAALHLIYHGL